MAKDLVQVLRIFGGGAVTLYLASMTLWLLVVGAYHFVWQARIDGAIYLILGLQLVRCGSLDALRRAKDEWERGRRSPKLPLDIH